MERNYSDVLYTLRWEEKNVLSNNRKQRIRGPPTVFSALANVYILNILRQHIQRDILSYAFLMPRPPTTLQLQ